MAIDVTSRVIVRTTQALERGMPYIFHQGGTSSGKTFGILYALLYYALKYLRKGGIISIVSENLPHLKRGALTDFQTILVETGLIDTIKENKSNHTYYLPGEKKIEFFATDNEQKAKSGKRDILFLNEVNGIKWAIANQLMIRTRGSKIMDWNPSGKFWLHKKLLQSLQPSEYVFTRTTYLDNKGANKETVENIERLKLIDPTLYDVYGKGIEGYGSDLIYSNWKVVHEFPDTRRTAHGIDFGYTAHPSTCIRGALYNGELWFDEVFYGKGMSNKKIADTIKEFKGNIGSGVADSAEPKSIDELRGYGLDVRGCVKGKDSIKFGINRIKQYPINITARSINILEEIEYYKWIVVDGIPTDKPKDGNDHCMDGMRYLSEELLADPVQIKMVARKASDFGLTTMGI